VADERGQVVDRRVGVVAAPGRPAGDGVEPIREGRAAYRAEPAVADAEPPREKVVDRKLLAVVVAHDDDRLDRARICSRLDVVGGEAAVPARELLVHARARVARVLLLCEGRPLEPEDGVRATVVLVRHAVAQAVDVEPVLLEVEVAKHVVERAVLEHEHDHVLDVVERCDGLVDLDLHPADGGVRPAAEERA